MFRDHLILPPRQHTFSYCCSIYFIGRLCLHRLNLNHLHSRFEYFIYFLKQYRETLLLHPLNLKTRILEINLIVLYHLEKNLLYSQLFQQALFFDHFLNHHRSKKFLLYIMSYLQHLQKCNLSK